MSERYSKLCGGRKLERSSDHSQRQKVGVVMLVLECSQSPQIPFRSEESRYADQAELHWQRIYILSLLLAYAALLSNTRISAKTGNKLPSSTHHRTDRRNGFLNRTWSGWLQALDGLASVRVWFRSAASCGCCSRTALARPKTRMCISTTGGSSHEQE